MKEIFLSASIPIEGRGPYFHTADPYLIQCAVRDFATVVLGRRHIIFGGHPAITPLLWAVCEELGLDFIDNVTLYQSELFEGNYPLENIKFKNVIYINKCSDNIKENLFLMRNKMLSREQLESAVFIGGMDGILEEYMIFKKFHPNAKIVAVSSPGGASKELSSNQKYYDSTNFTKLFYSELEISPCEERKISY